MSIGPQFPSGWKPKQKSVIGETLSESEPEDNKKDQANLSKNPETILSSSSKSKILSCCSKQPGKAEKFVGLIEDEKSSENEFYGPVLPPELREEDNDTDEGGVGIIGPSLPPAAISEQHQGGDDDYETRLEQFRRKQLLKDLGKQKREEWMTELPAKLQNYGLGARSFSKSGVESSHSDHSAWTETPADRLRKALDGSSDNKVQEETVVSKSQMERDRELENRAAQMNMRQLEGELKHLQEAMKALAVMSAK